MGPPLGPVSYTHLDVYKRQAFACAIGEQNYALYFLSNGAQLLVAGFSGLEESEISAILGSLRF